MYHYVRNKSKLFPNYNILEKKIFVNQIKKFSKSGLISLYEELFIPSDKFLATFDDGFKDHIFAAEVLKNIILLVFSLFQLYHLKIIQY